MLKCRCIMDVHNWKATTNNPGRYGKLYDYMKSDDIYFVYADPNLNSVAPFIQFSEVEFNHYFMSLVDERNIKIEKLISQ